MTYRRYITCPLCGTEQPYSWAFMGNLGFVAHYRCRACGADWSSQDSGDSRDELDPEVSPVE